MKKTFLFLLALALFNLPEIVPAAPSEVYLNISKKANPKIRILVPAPSPQGSRLYKAVLRDLQLSGLMLPLYEGDLIAKAQEADRVAGRILFPNWAQFQADVLLKIEDASSAKQTSFKVLAFSLHDRGSVLSKRYQAEVGKQKKLVHTMVHDLIKSLTGAEGISLSKIAFVSDATGDKELYVMDYDGDNVRRLSTDRSILLYPRWSPQGEELVALSYLRGRPNICRIGLHDGSRTFIAAFPGLNAGASYSPDSTHLALTLSKDGNPEIYRLNLANGRVLRLTDDKASESSPTWSPDGSQIAFASNRGGSPQIYTMNADGSTQRRVTFLGGYNTSPAWSPKGNLIAYCGLTGKKFQIFVLDVATGKSHQITDNDRDNEDPAWAPDGRHLVYTSSRNYKSDIFIVDTHDPNPVQLTQDLGNCVSPSWSRNFLHEGGA